MHNNAPPTFMVKEGMVVNHYICDGGNVIRLHLVGINCVIYLFELVLYNNTAKWTLRPRINQHNKFPNVLHHIHTH
jgi:hypothetical protein